MPCHFISVLNGEWKTRLQIPQLFSSSISLAPKTVVVKNACSKHLWEVDIEEEEEDPTQLSFKKGWSKFVKDNALVASDVLLFKFDGNSIFKVVICGKSGCTKVLEVQEREQMNPKERKQSCNDKMRASTQDCGENRKGKNLILVEIEEDRLDSDEIWDDEEEDEKEEQEHQEEESDQIGDIVLYEPRDSVMRIGEGSSLTVIPSFRMQLGLASAKKGVMPIPTDFFKKYMIKKKHEVEIETTKGVWKVTSLPHLKSGRMYARFSKGWAEFVRKNRFQVGETLLFRMIQQGDRPKFIVCME